MSVCGVIAEYNPFHYGHLHHLLRAREITGRDYLAVFMSGNFVQRGEPAIVDKYARARMALLCGADIVIELPLISAVSSAEGFARGAVAALEAAGADSICFGAEDADIRALSAAAEALYDCDRTPEFARLLRHYLKTGAAFPAARSMALKSLGAGADLLNSPNNILAVEYLKAMRRTGSRIRPFVVAREGAGYNETDAGLKNPSATAIRRAVFERGPLAAMGLMPPPAYKVFADQVFADQASADGAPRGFAPVKLDDFSEIFQYNIRRGADWLKNIAVAGEGIENRLLRAASRAWNISDVLDIVKTRRYTRTALQRLALDIVLGITGEEVKKSAEGPGFLRVLGFRRAGAPALSYIAARAAIPLVTNVKHAPDGATALLSRESRRNDIYYLPQARRGLAYPLGYDMSAPMVIV